MFAWISNWSTIGTLDFFSDEIWIVLGSFSSDSCLISDMVLLINLFPTKKCYILSLLFTSNAKLGSTRGKCTKISNKILLNFVLYLIDFSLPWLHGCIYGRWCLHCHGFSHQVLPLLLPCQICCERIHLYKVVRSPSSPVQSSLTFNWFANGGNNHYIP